jgi:4-hydroxy-tetrahydrodipicolinate synthase
MKPLSSSEIKGNWATLLLPINSDNSISYSKLAREIDTLISMGVDGIYSNGTAGEFYNQTEDEFDRVSTLLAEKCNAAGMPFQIGCSHMSPVISLDRLKRIVLLQPSAIQVILPDWFKPTMPEIIDYLKVMSELADPIGLVLYNPPHAKKRLTPEEFFQIKEAGIPLVGCKVPGGDESWYREMSNLVPELSTFIPGHHLATGILNGAQGAYSNVACINPLAAQKWYEMILSDIDEALELQSRIQLFMNRYIVPYITEKGYSNQAVDKLMAAVGGWTDITPKLRWPYRSIDEGDVAKIRSHCQELLPEFFSKSMNEVL